MHTQRAHYIARNGRINPQLHASRRNRPAFFCKRCRIGRTIPKRFGIGMETIDKWGPWMDLVSIYIIPIGATLGAISWFYVMKKDELLAAVNTGSKKERGALWYNVGRFVYVPFAVILCCVALVMHGAF